MPEYEIPDSTIHDPRMIVPRTIVAELSESLRLELQEFLASTPQRQGRFALVMLLCLGLVTALELEADLPAGTPEAETPLNLGRVGRIFRSVWETI